MKEDPKGNGSLRNRWGLPLIAAAVCVFLLAVFLHYSAPARSNPEATPSRSSPSPPDSTTAISCLGRLLPGGRILRVAAPPGSVVGELLVRRGQRAEQGEVLARLRDYARESALLLRAEKDVAVAAAELERVRAGEKASSIQAQKSAVTRQETVFQHEESQYQRDRYLFQSGSLPARNFEESQARRDSAREALLGERHRLDSLKNVRGEDVALAASKVDAAESARKVAMENVELNVIRAPVSGRILDIHAFPGEAVHERGLLEMGGGDEMLVEAEVHVRDIARVRMGARAAVSGDAIPGALRGEVSEIVSMVSRSDVMPTDPLAFSDQRIVKVWIRLQDSDAVAQLCNLQVSVEIEP